MSFVLMTDSSANLPEREVQKYGVTVVPLSYFVDGEEHCCSCLSDFDGERYYHMLGQLNVTTSQVAPQRYTEYMEPHLQAGEDVLFLGLSSGVSGSFSSAGMAAEQLRNKYPERKIVLIDTRGASLGEGLLVLRAAKCREKGLSLEETAEILLGARHRMCQIFTVDDLMFLRRGGRLSGATAIVGTVLSIKPILIGSREGTIVMSGKVRGRKQALAALAEKYKELAVNPQDQIVGISQAACEEDAGVFAEMLRKIAPPAEILTVPFEPVTGSHVGPGTLALFFEGNDAARLSL